jgi:hypothetical protein
MPQYKSIQYPLAIDEMSVDKMPVDKMTGCQNRMFPRQHEKVFFSLSKYLNTKKKLFVETASAPSYPALSYKRNISTVNLLSK